MGLTPSLLGSRPLQPIPRLSVNTRQTLNTHRLASPSSMPRLCQDLVSLLYTPINHRLLSMFNE